MSGRFRDRRGLRFKGGRVDFPLRVLVIGLDPYKVPGPWDTELVAEAIEAGMARFADHSVGAESCLFGLDGSDDVEAVITAALCAQPRESVVIGGGVRKPEDQLELFERVVSLVRQHAPSAAIAFNSSPADTFDAAARWVDVPSRSLYAASRQTAIRTATGGDCHGSGPSIVLSLAFRTRVRTGPAAAD